MNDDRAAAVSQPGHHLDPTTKARLLGRERWEEKARLRQEVLDATEGVLAAIEALDPGSCVLRPLTRSPETPLTAEPRGCIMGL